MSEYKSNKYNLNLIFSICIPIIIIVLFMITIMSLKVVELHLISLQ